MFCDVAYANAHASSWITILNMNGRQRYSCMPNSNRKIRRLVYGSMISLDGLSEGDKAVWRKVNSIKADIAVKIMAALSGGIDVSFYSDNKSVRRRR